MAKPAAGDDVTGSSRRRCARRRATGRRRRLDCAPPRSGCRDLESGLGDLPGACRNAAYRGDRGLVLLVDATDLSLLRKNATLDLDDEHGSQGAMPHDIKNPTCSDVGDDDLLFPF
jgi:hypothetical protein